MLPPPLRPEPGPAARPAPKRAGRVHRLMELMAESDVGDYLTAIAAGFKAFRDARRLRNGQEIPKPKQPEERDI